jgi:hypothetical protein
MLIRVRDVASTIAHDEYIEDIDKLPPFPTAII